MKKDINYYSKKITAKSDALDTQYNGAYYGMSKQNAIEAITLSLFEGFDLCTEEPPNPNPHEYQIGGYVKNIKRILEEVEKPYMFVSVHAFKVWHDRKNGIIKDYWNTD